MVTFGRVDVYFVDNYDRKGVWEQMACDRVRFEKRIQDTELNIGYVFDQVHRNKIRFQQNKCKCCVFEKSQACIRKRKCVHCVIL